MSYYTEFEIKILIDESKDKEHQIINLFSNFKFLNNEIKYEQKEFDKTHKFFSLERWERLFSFHHGYESPYCKRIIRNNKPYLEIFLTGEINYGFEEIQEFTKFISPFIAGHKPKTYIGWYEGESDRSRNNLYCENETSN